MKSSIFLVATGALLAAAGPLGKRVMKTELVVEVVTVTVTVDGPQPTGGAVYVQNVPQSTPISTPPQPTYEAPPPPARKPETSVNSAPPAPPTPSPVYSTIVYSPPPQRPSQPVQAPAPPPQKPSPSPSPSPSATPSSPPPPPPPPPPPAALAQPAGGDYQSTMLYHHNIHRANHSAEYLEWDDTLTQYAKNTATSCVFAHDMKQGNGNYGQNLASSGSSGDISGLQVKVAAQGITDQWYNDEMMNWQFYGLDNPPSGVNFEGVGHFTQVVWAGSKKVGCYTALCPAGSVSGLPSWYTVCDYSPPGNFGGEYGKNVLKPLGQAMVVV